MTRSDNKIINILPGAVTLAVSAFLAAGVQLIFHACIHEDGSVGTCHWAQLVIFAGALLMAAQSVLMIVFRKGRKRAAVSGCVFLTSIAVLLVPDTLIKLCMMPSMHCQAYMKPWTIILCLIIAAVNLVSFISGMKSERETK